MPSFLENLRLQSLYGGGNPFKPKTESPLKLMDQFINRLPRPMIPLPPPMAAPPIVEEEIEPTAISYGGITPYQQAQLELQKEALGVRERLGSAGIESREKIAGEREETKRDELTIRQQRADVYEFKARNPDAKIITQKGGNVLAINPITGETIRDFGSSGMLSDAERIALEQAGSVEQIRERGREERETEKTRQTGRESLQQMRERHAREQAEFESQLPGKTSALPSQQKNAMQMKYNRLINEHPEWRNWISLDAETGLPIIAESGAKTGMIGMRDVLSPEIHAQIKAALFGSEVPAAPAKIAETPSGRIRVRRKSDGKTGTISESQFDTSKYERIK